MSVLILDDTVFDRLASAALAFGIAADEPSALKVGRTLRRANVRAYDHRYPAHRSEAPPGPYVWTPTAVPTGEYLQELLAALEYNVIGSPGWTGSRAERTFKRLRAAGEHSPSAPKPSGQRR